MNGDTVQDVARRVLVASNGSPDWFGMATDLARRVLVEEVETTPAPEWARCDACGMAEVDPACTGADGRSVCDACRDVDEVTRCDRCGGPYDETNGDGYCGLCPSCADIDEGAPWYEVPECDPDGGPPMLDHLASLARTMLTDPDGLPNVPEDATLEERVLYAVCQMDAIIEALAPSTESRGTIARGMATLMDHVDGLRGLCLSLAEDAEEPDRSAYIRAAAMADVARASLDITLDVLPPVPVSVGVPSAFELDEGVRLMRRGY